MTPSFIGRVQTRLFLLGTVGVVWTLLVTPLLPSNDGLPGESRIGDLYSTTFGALVTIAVVGVVVWEPIYHGLQQLRWEKDWPILFGLLTGIPEGLVAWAIVREMVMDSTTVPSDATFWWHFCTTWVIVWLVANGPLRVVLIRWRYRGGRIR